MDWEQTYPLSPILLEGEEVEKIAIEVEHRKKGWAWKIFFYFSLLLFDWQ